jgi:hypothetical protein
LRIVHVHPGTIVSYAGVGISACPFICPRLPCRCTYPPAVSANLPHPQGAANSLEYRLFLSHKGTTVSPWHDIPLYAGSGLVNFVCEIPKETAAKMEVATVRLAASPSQPGERKTRSSANLRQLLEVARGCLCQFDGPHPLAA